MRNNYVMGKKGEFSVPRPTPEDSLCTATEKRYEGHKQHSTIYGHNFTSEQIFIMEFQLLQARLERRIMLQRERARERQRQARRRAQARERARENRASETAVEREIRLTRRRISDTARRAAQNEETQDAVSLQRRICQQRRLTEQSLEQRQSPSAVTCPARQTMFDIQLVHI